jgi:fatty-acyl-CoA synthase
MARYKAPKYVWFVDEFPLTASGKIQKFLLRDMASEWLATGAVEAAPTYKAE